LITDPDYDSTILASDKSLQGMILNEQRLETLDVAAGASLLANADVVNRSKSTPSN
jgi:hypothetical protein